MIDASISAVWAKKDLPKLWFGEQDKSNYDSVEFNLNKMEQWMTGVPPVTIDLTDPDRKRRPDIWAYAFLGGFTVYVCPLFFARKLPQRTGWRLSSTNRSRSRMLPGPEVYGRDACKKLEEDDPSHAIKNADNYCVLGQRRVPEAPVGQRRWGKAHDMAPWMRTRNDRPAAAISSQNDLLMDEDRSRTLTTTSISWRWYVKDNTWTGPTRIVNKATGTPCKT